MYGKIATDLKSTGRRRADLGRRNTKADLEATADGTQSDTTGTCKSDANGQQASTTMYLYLFRSDQIRSVTQSCPTLCDPMNRSTPGLPVHHQLPEFTQTHSH